MQHHVSEERNMQLCRWEKLGTQIPFTFFVDLCHDMPNTATILCFCYACWSKVFSFLNVFFAYFQPYLGCYIIIGIAENEFLVCFVLILLVMACQVSETTARFRSTKSSNSFKSRIRYRLSKLDLEFYCWTILFGFKIKQDQLLHLRILFLCHIIFVLIWYQYANVWRAFKVNTNLKNFRFQTSSYMFSLTSKIFHQRRMTFPT